MKAKDIKEGSSYRVKLYGNMTTVRVNKIEVKEGYRFRTVTRKATTRYRCLNMMTNREVTIKSAAKFLEKVEGHGQKLSFGSSKPSTQNIPKSEGEQSPDPMKAKTSGITTPSVGPTASVPADISPKLTSPPVKDTCKWEPRNEYGFPMFRINERVYNFQFTKYGVELSYLNEKMEMVVYEVSCTKAGKPSKCTCPASVPCKHMRALKVALPLAPYSLV